MTSRRLIDGRRPVRGRTSSTLLHRSSLAGPRKPKLPGPVFKLVQPSQRGLCWLLAALVLAVLGLGLGVLGLGLGVLSLGLGVLSLGLGVLGLGVLGLGLGVLVLGVL